MKPRVLFLDHVGALGGAEMTLIDVAKAFRSSSTFLLFDDGPFRERLEACGVRVEVIRGGRALHSVRRETRWPGLRAAWETFTLATRLLPLAREHDFLHANSQKAFIVACIAGKLSGRPVIWDLNDLLLPEHFSMLNIKLDVWLARHCAVRVVANSHASARALIAQGGPVHKTHVVYNGISPEPFDAITGDDIAEARAEFGLHGVPVAGVFGRLAEWKGQRVALEALRALPEVHLLLVGDALFGEREYADALKARVDELGLGDRVHFTGFRSDIPRLMRMVDVVLHTSTAPEPFGRVIVEGMLANRPVIATRGGGVEEILDQGRTGIMVTPGRPDELSAAIRELLADPERTARMVAAARQVATDRFTVEAMVEAMEYQIDQVARAQ